MKGLNMPELDQRVAMVTGANRGLGLTISRQLALKGITVIVAVRNENKGRAAREELNAQGLEAIHVQYLDVADVTSIHSALAQTKKVFGRLDILVNNAGIKLDDQATIVDMKVAVLQKTLQTNFYGPLALCQSVLPLMRAGQYGRIVNISSTLGSLADMADLNSLYSGPQAPAYRLSKTILNGLTALIARDVNNDNILVNSACPGWVRTDLGGHQAPRSPEQGADTPVWLATLPDNGPSGGFFRDREQIAW
jgi:NAD(P)-dependent dehydrogenase (short-subunit alcohol dehydrogenase family)